MSGDQSMHLLTVEDRFELKGGGIVVAPDFALPANSCWKDYTFLVTVTYDDGTSKSLRAIATSVHLLVRDPSVARRGWRLVVNLPSASKGDVPVGSKLHCSLESYERLFGVGSAHKPLSGTFKATRA
ncbi:MAG: hypothetical protein SXG53_04810 [Pseudomonadota bacterium]|nr:hypothetical protein [Pseudomonadota bacterium]